MRPCVTLRKTIATLNRVATVVLETPRLTHHALMLCSKCKLNAKLRKIKLLLLSKGYPEYVITTTIER